MQLRRELVAADVTDQEMARRVRTQEWEHLRRGAYRLSGPATPEERHRELLLASLAQVRKDGAIASHVSAAVVHGLPIDKDRLGRAHLLREGRSRSSVGGAVWRHQHPVVDATITDGIPVTSFTTTVIDLARWLPWGEAVAVTDVALRSTSRANLLATLDVATGQRGIRRARRAIEFADPRSGSPGESRSRALMAELGLPMPDALQLPVVDWKGEMWCDFGWKAQRVVGEFDGEVKYGRLLKPGQSVEDVVLAEKDREQRLRRKRWWAIRWTWDDLHHPRSFARLITEGLGYWDTGH